MSHSSMSSATIKALSITETSFLRLVELCHGQRLHHTERGDFPAVTQWSQGDAQTCIWTFCDFWLEVLRVHLYWPGNSLVDSANYTGHGSLGGKQNTQWVPHALQIPAAIALDVPSVSVSAFYRDCVEVNIIRVQLNLDESSSKHNNIGAHSCPSVRKIQKNF